MRGPIYPTILMAGLYNIFSFIISKKIAPKNRKIARVIACWVAIILTFVLLGLIYIFAGIDLIQDGIRSENWGTLTYKIFLVFIPMALFVTMTFYIRKYPQSIPNRGIWYCDKLQLQLCFDDSGSSFIVKDQKTIPGRLEIKDKSKYLYLIAHDPLEGCVFSGKFRSRTKNKMEIKNRSDDYIYSFVQIQQPKQGLPGDKRTNLLSPDDDNKTD